MGCWRVYSGLVEKEALEAEDTYGAALDRGKEICEAVFDPSVVVQVIAYIDPFEETKRFMLMVDGDSPEADGWLSFSHKDEAVVEFRKVEKRYLRKDVEVGASVVPV